MPRMSLSIRLKLYVLGTVCVAGVATLASGALYFSSRVEQATQTINEQRFAPLSRLQDLNGRLKEVRFRLAGVLLDQMPIPGSRNQLQETVQVAPTEWSDFKGAAGNLGADPEKLIADIDNGLPVFEQFSSRLDHAYATNDKKALEGLLEDEWPMVQLKLVKPLDALVPALSAAVADETRAVQASAKRFRLLMGVAAAAIGAITLLIALLVTRAVTGPLRQAVEQLQQIGSGRLDNVIETGRRDELGELLTGMAATQAALRQRAEAEHRHVEQTRARAEADRRALAEVQDIVAAISAGELDRRLTTQDKTGFAEELARSLNGLIDNVAGVVAGLQRIVDGANQGDLSRRLYIANRSGLEQRIGESVNRMIAEMATLVARAKDTAAEVSRGSQEISQGNTRLSKRTEEQSASLEQTAASMEQMTSTVRQNADNARQANVLAIEARSRAERGGAVVTQVVEAMQGISTASKKIADIIGVIDGIAFQTNLLALNAAVEAARAGELGRGFAVVAAEVRGLASRSAEAAKEIKALIQDSVSRVEDGAHLVSESGQTLEELVAAVKKVSDIIAEISSASAEQATGIDQVSRAVTQMDQLTQQNAALVEEAATASRSLAESSGALDTMLSRYRISAEEAGRGRPQRTRAA